MMKERLGNKRPIYLMYKKGEYRESNASNMEEMRKGPNGVSAFRPGNYVDGDGKREAEKLLSSVKNTTRGERTDEPLEKKKSLFQGLGHE